MPWPLDLASGRSQDGDVPLVRHQAFHAWPEEVRLREAWHTAGLVDDGPATYGPGEAGAAAVRAADPRNVSAARRERWIALSQGQGPRPGTRPRRRPKPKAST